MRTYFVSRPISKTSHPKTVAVRLTCCLTSQIVVQLEDNHVPLPHALLVEPPMSRIVANFIRLVNKMWIHDVHRHQVCFVHGAEVTESQRAVFNWRRGQRTPNADIERPRISWCIEKMTPAYSHSLEKSNSVLHDCVPRVRKVELKPLSAGCL